MHFSLLVLGPDPEAQLAPFDQCLDIPPYVSRTREQLIAESRRATEWRQERYDEYLANPALFRSRNSQSGKELLAEITERLAWTDEQHCQDQSSGEELDAHGNELSTYNENGKWDYYKTTGGRWDNNLELVDGDRGNETTVGQLKLNDTPPTYAILDHGVWTDLDASDMTEDEWKAAWPAVIAAQPADTPVTLYDCHG